MIEAISKAMWCQALKTVGRIEFYAQPQQDILETMPPIPEAYLESCTKAAEEMAYEIGKAMAPKAPAMNRIEECGVEEWVLRAFHLQHNKDPMAREWPLDAATFGHYAVMTAADEGVGLWEFVTGPSWRDSPLEGLLNEVWLQQHMDWMAAAGALEWGDDELHTYLSDLMLSPDIDLEDTFKMMGLVLVQAGKIDFQPGARAPSETPDESHREEAERVLTSLDLSGCTRCTFEEALVFGGALLKLPLGREELAKYPPARLTMSLLDLVVGILNTGDIVASIAQALENPNQTEALNRIGKIVTAAGYPVDSGGQ